MDRARSKDVLLDADREIIIGEAIELMDLLKAAGAEQVTLMSN